MSIQILSPAGTIGAAPAPRAAGRAVLTGLAVGVLDNGKPNAGLLMTRLADRLAARSGAHVGTVTGKGPGHNAATPCSDAVLAQLSKEVDLVITGSAD